MLCEKLPKLAIHLGQLFFQLLFLFLSPMLYSESHGVDMSLFSLNWFLCIFVGSTPVNTYLHIWDSFLFEGSKVAFIL